MIRVTETADTADPVQIDFSGGQGNLPGEQEIHLALHVPGGGLVMAWFKKAELEYAILRATHPAFNRTEPYPASERNAD